MKGLRKKSASRKKKFDFVIIGGGPIGLILAYHLYQKFGRSQSILLLEKRLDYTRKQILLVTKKSMDALPPAVHKKLFGPGAPGCYVLPPSKDNLARCYQKRLSLASIRTNTLEGILYQYLTSVGITIKRGVKTIEFSDTYPELRASGVRVQFGVLIGADGANSVVRQDVLKARFTANSQIKQQAATYGSVFNFDAAPLRPVNIAASKNIQRRVATMPPQHVHRYFRGQTGGSYYIGLRVNEQEQKDIVSGILPNDVKQRLDKICKSVTKIGVGCHFSNLSHMTAFPIKPKVASRFSCHRPYPTFLVGDAAITTHYFTGVGFNGGVQSALVLADLLDKYAGKVPVGEYKTEMTKLARFAGDKVNEVLEA